MTRPRRSGGAAVLLVVLSLLLGACADGDDADPVASTSTTQVDSPSESPSGAAEGPLCEAAQEISDLDDEAQGVVNDLIAGVSSQTSQAAAQRSLEEGLRRLTDEVIAKLPALNAAYKRLEAAVPAELKDDVRTVQRVSVALARELASIRSVDEFRTLEQRFAALGVEEAGKATLAIDAVTREECGITFAD